MKLDKTFQGFLNSFGIAIITCTLIVSIGKYITPYYFFYSITSLLIILIILTSYNYYIYKVEISSLKQAREEKRITDAKLANTRKKWVLSRVEATKQCLLNTKIEDSLRKWAMRKKNLCTQDQQIYIVNDNIRAPSSTYISLVNTLPSTTSEEGKLDNGSSRNKSSMKKSVDLANERVGTSMKVIRKSSKLRKHVLLKNSFGKGREHPITVTVV